MNYQSQIESYFQDKEVLLVEAVSRLVRVRSVRGEAAPGAPFGPGPAAALDEALKLVDEWGLNPTNHEGYVGTADLNHQETVLHILGHLDVVDEGTGWTITEPYNPKVVDGCIFGRGTDDDKGPVVASLLALKCIKDLGIPMQSNVRVIMGTDEESGSEDLEYYFAHNPYALYTFTPDSGFPVINVEKGRYTPTFTRNWPETDTLPRLAWFHGGIRMNILPGDADCAIEGLTVEQVQSAAETVTAKTGVQFIVEVQDGLTHIAAKGVGSHAAWPQGGTNAITGLLTLLETLPLTGGAAQAIADLNTLLPHNDYSGTALGIAQADQISEDLTLSFTLLNITSTGLEGYCDCRVPICANEENCANVARNAFEQKGFRLTGTMAPAHYTPGDSPFVQTLLKCYETYTGLKGECLTTGGGTYVHDIPGGVAFGAYLPGFDTHLHGADERARISDLMVSAKIFAQVIVELCGAEA